MTRILGIDPGYERLGVAVIDKKGGEDTILYSNCLRTSAKQDIYKRFADIGAKLETIMDKFKPEVLAIENLFVSKNRKTAMRVSEVRGIILYEAVKRGLSIHEYSPMEVKMSVTGSGSSDKSMIAKMVKLLVKVPSRKTLDDEYDAIAVALTCSAAVR